MNNESIRHQVMYDLLKGVRVTPLYGIMTYKTIDLRKRLSELRNEGMPIESKWEVNATTGKRYKVHYMTPEAIEKYKADNNIFI